MTAVNADDLIIRIRGTKLRFGAAIQRIEGNPGYVNLEEKPLQTIGNLFGTGLSPLS
ncbi:hypothetical protein [Rhizobium sp. S163]|uniref:hypothetical protein n=1 Tax=Rhizobium sp. S163 TaxID=3055039 RepID=UPI0025A96C1D|nr:hypothetical protein [Rhizobium sp. S163]MDM9644719.1 hypothetical protein [Rhizobium sp. S163]